VSSVFSPSPLAFLIYTFALLKPRKKLSKVNHPLACPCQLPAMEGGNFWQKLFGKIHMRSQ